jgi:hypothetical protein
MQFDPPQIIRESRPQKTANILEKECSWAKLSNSPNGFGPHVTAIPRTSVLAPDRKRLTGGASSSQIDWAVQFAPINLTYISLGDGPVSYMLNFSVLIVQ